MSVSTIVTLLRHAWARHRLPLIPIALAMGLFEFLLTRLAPAPNELSWMATLLVTLPPEVRALMGNDVALSPGGFLALGYEHPFFILLLSTWVVRTTSAAIAGEVGLKTMDLLASRPVPRWTFVAAGMKTVALGLGIIVACAWIGTAIGLHLRALDVRASAFVPVAAGVWLLFTAWGAVGLAIGSACREGGRAIAWTTTVIATSFVLDYLARLWAPISGLRPFSLFRYYEPQAILAAGLPPRTILVLAATIVAGLAASVVIVHRRDL